MEFNFLNLPELEIIIKYYTDHFDKFSNRNIFNNLYSFISAILLYQNNTDQLNDISLESDSQEIILFTRFIDSLKYDEYFINFLIFKLDAYYFTIQKNKETNTLTKIQNKSFRKWCEKWQTIYDKNTRKAKIIKNIIIPFQKKFLERLWNPNTVIGYQFAIKHMNKLDWEPDHNLSFPEISNLPVIE